MVAQKTQLIRIDDLTYQRLKAYAASNSSKISLIVKQLVKDNLTIDGGQDLQENVT
jgi:hypothetical protein